jgi:hypothetical protein
MAGICATLPLTGSDPTRNAVADAMEIMAAGYVADRTAQRRTEAAYIGVSDGWVAAHPLQAAATQARLAAIAQIAARLVTLRNPQPPDDDQDRALERMMNEGAPAMEAERPGGMLVAYSNGSSSRSSSAQPFRPAGCRRAEDEAEQHQPS